MPMRKLKKYKPTRFMAKDSRYDKDAADFAVMFIESLCHTKGTWAGRPFELIDWQEQIIRDLFGILKPNGYRQFNTAYIDPRSKARASLRLPLPCFFYAVTVRSAPRCTAALLTATRRKSSLTWRWTWCGSARRFPSG